MDIAPNLIIWLVLAILTFTMLYVSHSNNRKSKRLTLENESKSNTLLTKSIDNIVQKLRHSAQKVTQKPSMAKKFTANLKAH
jgi:CHASE1-domain containing sensor protein